MSKSKITVVGAGYVGMSLSVLLSQKYDVISYDIDKEKVDKILKKESTCSDIFIEKYLKEKSLSLSATLDKEFAYKNSEIIIVATPTDFNSDIDYFDTSSVFSVVGDILKINKDAFIVIKSTIPVGYTKFLQSKFNSKNIIFSPEFLREGHALEDNLYPSRIIIGGKCKRSIEFSNILGDLALADCEKLFMDSSEAEATKLFSNTFLAMRVAFFNELDSYALSENLDTKSIINGICHDSRIGMHYNNPSFGYGGYCLPKDTKQLLSNYKKIPQTLIKAIVSSNETRKDFISHDILKKQKNKIGIYRLVMKESSDNYRASAIFGIIDKIIEKNSEIEIIIYEPLIKGNKIGNYKVIHDLESFKENAELVIANRVTEEILDIRNKIYTRDIFREN